MLLVEILNDSIFTTEVYVQKQCRNRFVPTTAWSGRLQKQKNSVLQKCFATRLGSAKHEFDFQNVFIVKIFWARLFKVQLGQPESVFETPILEVMGVAGNSLNRDWVYCMIQGR
jgi:hypothetical protein